MPHLSNAEHFSHLSENIETRDCERLIDEIEHSLVKLWIDGFPRVVEKSWSMCPSDLPALDETTITDYIEVAKIKQHCSDDIFS